MHEEALEIVSKISFEEIDDPLEESEESGVVKLRLSAYMKGEDIMTLCEMVAMVRLSTHEGFDFFFKKLTDKQIYKLFIILESHIEADEAPYQVKVVCELATKILTNMVKTPCEISLEIDEVGYFKAIEDRLGIYVPQEDFNEAHLEAHRIIDMIVTTQHIGGWIKKIHKN